MRELALTVTLLNDVIVNERPANEGGHKSLDYLPGHLLLGAVAARLYAQLSRADAWCLFHSGQVHFGNALPLMDNHPVWPLPLCWHEAKDESAEHQTSRRLDARKVHNLAVSKFDPKKQPKQLREGYIRSDGYRHSVAKSLRMKTAIHPGTGRVAESQLFGYESINAGQVFVARIHAQDTVPDALWQPLTAMLTTEHELLLGRSRSAEYGRVRIEPWTADQAMLTPETKPTTNEQQVTLWCLSDVALLDAYGQPSLRPTAAALGLSRGEINWEHSFLRFRRYAVWNQYRNGYDLERQVIRQGSVIALTGFDSPLTDDERARLAGGVGLYQENGLGCLSVNAQLLADDHPQFAPPVASASQQLKTQPKPDHPLIVWLEQQRGSAEIRQQAEKASETLRQRLKDCYANAHKFSGVSDDLPIGPSPAQWGTLYEAARVADSANLSKLRTMIFDEKNGLCKETGDGWQDEFRDTHQIHSFFSWFQAETETIASVQTLRLFLREAQRVARHEHRGSKS